MARSLQNTVRRHASLSEPETERLQHAADTFTQKLALEKRRNVSLNDRIGMMTKLVEGKKEEIARAQADNHEQKRLRGRTEQLENQMLKERQKLNQHLLRNENLREKVDIYRREKRAFLSTFKDFENEEKQFARESAMAYKSFIAVHNVDSKTAHEIVRLKLKAEAELDTCEVQAYQLQSAIDLERKEEQVKVRKQASAMMEDLTSNKEFVDMRGILKELSDCWVTKAVEQKREIDQHTKDISVLTDAFSQIEEATGIASINEIVTSFIKSEEQNYVLYKHISALNTETDVLEEQLSDLTDHLASLQSASESQAQSLIIRNRLLEQQISSLHAEKVEKQRQIDSMNEHVGSLAEFVGDITTSVSDFPSVGDLVPEEFSHLTAEQTLGALEQGLNEMIGYLKTQAGGDPLLVSDLPDKDFDWKAPDVSALTDLIQEGVDEEDHPLTKTEFSRKLILRVRKQAKAADKTVGT